MIPRHWSTTPSQNATYPPNEWHRLQLQEQFSSQYAPHTAPTTYDSIGELVSACCVGGTCIELIWISWPLHWLRISGASRRPSSFLPRKATPLGSYGHWGNQPQYLCIWISCRRRTLGSSLFAWLSIHSIFYTDYNRNALDHSKIGMT